MLIWAERAYPEECCGLIWVKKNKMNHVDKLELTKNIALNPLKHFEIDPKPLFDANRKSRVSDDKLIGVFHSHPNGRAVPSKLDASNVVLGQIWIIIANNSMRGWLSDENGEIYDRFNSIIINIVN